MPRRIRIYPYKQGSRSARALADATGGLVLRREGSRYRYRVGDVVVNWGSTSDIGIVPHGFMGIQVAEYLNDPEDVRKAANKLEAFQALSEGGVRVPRFWTSRSDIPEDARYPIVCRTVLNGHSGRGIILANTQADLVPAPLYTEYVPKTDEYRVHVFKRPTGEYDVIAVQRKARRLETPDEDINWQIRNHANGFVFVRNGFETPVDVTAQAVQSIISLGLDFGGVDVLWNERRQQAFVLEVNTACGLEGQTVNDYAEAIRQYL